MKRVFGIRVRGPGWRREGIPSSLRQGASCSLRSAFSLVEVALAIGILSFCLVSMMGLIPVALQTTRQSMNKSTEIRIVQSVRAALLSTNFSVLPPSGSFSFDREGLMLTNVGGTEYYRVLFSSAKNTILPGNNTASRLATTQLIISNTVTHDIHTNSLHLPDNGF